MAPDPPPELGPSASPARWHARLRRARYWLPLAVVFACFSYVYASQDLRDVSTASITAHGDGRYYYAYARSLVFDRDVDFSNDYALLGNPYNFAKTKRGKPTNKFTIGPAFYWAPFMGLAHGLRALSNTLGFTSDPLNGVSPGYQRIVFFGTVVWAFVALILMIRLLRQYHSEGTAMVTALAMMLATPLSWYVLRQPSYSHAISAFAVGAMILYWHDTFYQRRLRRWFVLGILAGLTMLVRPQSVGHVVVPLGEWIALMVITLRGDRKEIGRLFQIGLAFVGGGILAFSPQMLAWYSIYGSPITIPQGGDFMLWTHSRFSAVLFSGRHGLFAWSPLIYLGVIGLGVAIWRGESARLKSRLIPALMLLGFLVQVYLSGCTRDWYGGWAFGGRRFISCTIYFAFGLSFSFVALRGLIRRHGARLVTAVPAGLVAIFALLNLSMMDDYLSSAAKHGQPQPMAPIFKRALDRGFDKAYHLLGNLGAAPASWIFAARFGVSPARYDEVSGMDLFDGTGAYVHVDLASSPLPLGGFSDEAATSQGRRCRWVAGERAKIALPLRKPLELVATLSAMPALPKTRLRVEIAGKKVFEVAELKEGWQSYEFPIPKRLLGSGVNAIKLLQRSPPRPLFAVGKTQTRTVLEVSVRSEGFDVGKSATFTFNRKRVVRRERGMIAYRVDARGDVEELDVYDTFGKKAIADRFAARIEALPRGTIVLLAVSDEASRHWTPRADRALRSLGAAQSMLHRYRWSYALIGVKGAKAGQAIERAAANSPVTVTLGRPITDRRRGVAYSALTLRKK